jgi:hypothetical protein
MVSEHAGRLAVVELEVLLPERCLPPPHGPAGLTCRFARSQTSKSRGLRQPTERNAPSAGSSGTLADKLLAALKSQEK